MIFWPSAFVCLLFTFVCQQSAITSQFHVPSGLYDQACTEAPIGLFNNIYQLTVATQLTEDDTIY